MSLIQSMRWFGPDDPVSLSDIRQAGGTGIVTALHHFPNGEIWPEADIKIRKDTIERAGLRWDVVESVPVHEDIKRRTGNYDSLIRNYQETIRRLSRAGIKTICYNFMPVLDWTRTDLGFIMPDGGKALRFDIVALAAFDIFILKRNAATSDYSPIVAGNAAVFFSTLDAKQKDLLTQNIIAGLPGSEESYGLDDFLIQIEGYLGIENEKLKANLFDFINAIAPIADEFGVKMAIHPDDPPFTLFGLPRVVSTAEDIQSILDACDNSANGLCFCTGSFGARYDNDILSMAKAFKERVHFLHFRNVSIESQGVFHEANHLGGHVDFYEIMKTFVKESKRRGEDIPMRPDHGHQILDDFDKKTNPGYSAIGRLKGLAELRGLEYGINKFFKL